MTSVTLKPVSSGVGPRRSTRDAILESRETLVTLAAAFSHAKVAAAYGRGAPHHNAGECEAHAALVDSLAAYRIGTPAQQRGSRSPLILLRQWQPA